ncbi:peroxiredoxin [Mesorhizobium sp. M1409]|uniref:peroxiredoxin n=1 Tax=unclassified Mesorhizobium TaxID=325217 RepID=UPI0033392FB1
MPPAIVPNISFHTRVRNDALEGPNPFEWKTITSDEIFSGRNIVLFGLPGAFTPACSESHLPGFEQNYDDFREVGVDEVVCVAVNDAFVMYQWAKARGVQKVRMLPDGNGDFTRQMGMLVQQTSNGMGLRSWRYSMHVVDGEIRSIFTEPGLTDNSDGLSVTVSDAATMLSYLRAHNYTAPQVGERGAANRLTHAPR